MLFVCYWELNENMASADRSEIARRLVSTGAFPPPGVRLVRWDETPDAWGVAMFEAETAFDAAAVLHLWRAAGAGFFKLTKTAPAFPIDDASMKALEDLGRVARPA